ncbi:ectoine/hydroxyectoine ABC transporter permease subunit EhuC [Hydrogenibacillus schlegelii]|uniref:Ectoine/hydroxyectoine ABC transporter permease subunit EhuC n=1 Tax=Hydrogenibacillus schlegelii TaxID=1484 RepID=A0A132MIC4_HYDSH|nr:MULTISPECIES: ectoine/hydroxyectoine ABC transporter permease subunit EhuC [Hydrogenibacillus]KWW97171.1 amino acid ABC transporter permease [Hydrogenibacillus schlegelii]MBT9282702.1 ectoine/hydroxyectoine ABC transporter permease subunit EhuC [Hydrogenibacillus schlegelii]OAR04818.1 ectoine/hydroxyectoine ABC transporter permease subunit EhuC [Hydrogenibacillus schlegelii]QZA32598.1 ectoine/hydroxyectoine ABC transporter permease subunit EhuC [Hydrogenibacillus sp. N12]
MEAGILLLPGLLRGLRVTLEVFVLGAMLALGLSFAVGLLRLSRFPIVRTLAAAYVEFFRGTSLLIQLFWLYYALPFFGVELSALAAGVLGLGLNYGAYGSEVVRSAIRSVPKGQWEAAIALNLSPLVRFRRVILPQAWPLMLPPFGNLLIELLKGTSLVSMITLGDMTFQAMSLRTTYARYEVPLFLLLLVLYFLIATATSAIVRRLERRARVGRSA